MKSNLKVLIILLFASIPFYGQNKYSFTSDTTTIKEYKRTMKNRKVLEVGCEIKERFPNTKIQYLKTRFEIDCSKTKSNINIETIKNELKGTDISENQIYPALVCPNPISFNDIRYIYTPSRSWHLDMIEAQCAWSITTGNPNVIIGIADTDFQDTHEDYANKFSLIAGPVTQQNNHGMLVSGMAAPNTNNNLGIAGVGNNCRIDGQRVAHAPCTINGVAFSACGSAADAINSSFNNGDRIINISWGGTGLTTAEAQAFVNQGAVLIVAGGNTADASGNNNVGNIEGVILVGATDINNNIVNNAVWQSARNQFIDICAPGENLYTTNRNNDYASTSGTSLAAPIVAGVVALMRSANPCLTPQQIHQIIQRTADPIANEDQFLGLLGAGRINAYRAVKEAVTLYMQNLTTPNFTITTTRPFVNIGYDVDLRQSVGPVKLVSGTNWTINAREVEIKNDFEVPLGAELTINTSPTQPLGCP